MNEIEDDEEFVVGTGGEEFVRLSICAGGEKRGSGLCGRGIPYYCSKHNQAQDTIYDWFVGI